MEFQPKKLALAEFEKTEKAFQAIFSDAKQMNVVWNQLHAFFMSATSEQIHEYKHTYWRWYVLLTWKRLNTFSIEEFLEIVVRQIHTAILLLDNVWDSLAWFLYNKGMTEQEMQSYYRKIKEAFWNSDWEIGRDGGKEYTVRDIIAEIERQEAQNADTLELAQFSAHLQAVFYKSDPEFENYKQYYREDHEDVINDFNSMVHFFIGVPQDKIFYVVDAFVHPDEYDIEPENTEKEPSTVSEVNEEFERELDAFFNDDTNQPQEHDQKPISTSESDLQEKRITQDSQTPSLPRERPSEVSSQKVAVDYHAIKDMIEERFMKDEDGQIANMHGVLALLEAMAQQYEDDKIREIYYFDENEGRFVWNEALLK
ncbi:hypothetical protein H6758_04260 [Candidatus Nomurabacteria bacterium]|nr:hypothetical protein [Candidatus Nomurabacteria bacterium]